MVIVGGVGRCAEASLRSMLAGGTGGSDVGERAVRTLRERDICLLSGFSKCGEEGRERDISCRFLCERLNWWDCCPRLKEGIWRLETLCL